MKKKITRMLCLVLAMTTLLATGAMAASPTSTTGPDVRVNGEIVDFPDGQPYVDENNRTMIPVRFVSEELGAKVTWNGATQSAVIEKNGIQDVEKYLKTYIDNYNRGAVPYKKISILKVRKDEFPKNTLRKIMRFKLDMTID